MPCTSRNVETEDGRTIHVREWCRPSGIPALVQCGTPGAGILYHPWVEEAESCGIRLISYDRPGYGGSSPQPGRTIAGCARDVAAIAKELKLDRLLVWGLSGGGPHALACAALLPDLVPAAAILCSTAPYPVDDLDWFSGMTEENAAEFRTAVQGREALGQLVEAVRPAVLASTAAETAESFRSQVSPVDAAMISSDLADWLYTGMVEGVKDGPEGWIDDDLALISAWGFDPSQIRVPILLIHGVQDRLVPVAHAEWLAARIPGVDARLLPDDGHITMTRHTPEVYAWLLSKMP
jgi:pimeloyl-ACP methyl ester carboxylesterase